MKTRWLLVGAGLLIAAFALGAAACGDEGEEGATPTAAETEPVETPEATVETPEAAGQVEVTLAAEAGSGVTGSATLVASDGGTEVEVTVEGGLEPGTHASHIHTGTCADQGAVDVGLTSVDADAGGGGTASTSIADRPLAGFTDGNHYVAVHALDGSVVACGDIEAAG